MISWDLETHLIKPGNVYPRLVCYSEAPSGILLDREQGLDRIDSVLRGATSVGQHIFFDLGIAAAERPAMLPLIFQAIDEERVTDTLLRQKMIDNAEGRMKYVWSEEANKYKSHPGFSLQELVWRHLGFHLPKEDTWRLRYRELDGIAISEWPDDARTYSINDAKVTLDVYHAQEKLWPKGMTREVKQIQAGWALYLAGGWGVRTDDTAVTKAKEELTEAFDAQAKIAKGAGFVRKTGTRDMTAIKAAIKEALENPTETEKGAIKTDRDQLLATGNPALKAVAEMGRIGKMLTTYIPVLERGTRWPITARYNAIVETYRTSCSNPNLQNPPREGGIRECFIARPGCDFAFCDYDSLEMRTLAQICIEEFGHSSIADSIRDGKDPHVIMAADSMGIPYADALARYKSGDKAMKDIRQGSKIANYGMAGGMGAKAFISYAKGYGLTIPLERAKELHANYRKSWPEMVDYFAAVSELCKRGGGTSDRVTLHGSGYYRDDIKYPALCNVGFQHVAAMGAKAALYAVTKECYLKELGSPLYGCRPWLFAHDEIGMEIPTYAIGKEGRHRAAMRLQAVMIEEMRKYCPDVPIGATTALSKRWWKGAPPLEENGLLVPVKPGPKGKGWVRDDG